MQKSRIALVLAIGLLMLGIALNAFFDGKQPSVPTLPATVSRDCAPWDGAAFTLKIPLQDGSTISISIWQSPDIIFPRTFSFPDNSGQVGTASLIPAIGLPEQLDGEVTFQSVQEGIQFEGRFHFRTGGSGYFHGQFRAEWDHQVILCG